MNRDLLNARLSIEEGRRRVAYLDSQGILTVGIGHNCVAHPVPGVAKPGDTITDEQIDALFEQDVDAACADLDAHLPWWRSLDDARQNVMVDLCFNMGITVLKTFKNTMGYMAAGDWKNAEAGLDRSLWHRQVGKRADWLENVILTGVYA